jgi:Uncharacterised nucleotidyltransferase
VNEGSPASALARLAGALAADGVSGEVLNAWKRAGIQGVLIKGPTVAEWLYADHVRGYGDSDLLVSPPDRQDAARVLGELGFREEPYADANTSKHATPWFRERDGAVVDLHHRLWGAWGPTAQEQWDVFLSAWTEQATVGGREVLVPKRAARLMLIALHASQHRDLEGKPLEDLRRALSVAARSEWRNASILADLVGASREMASGLKRVPEGAEVFADLPLLRAALLDEPDRSRALERLRWSEARAARGTLTVIADAAQLRPHDLRWRYPLAHRGRVGMTLAATMRVGHLVRRAPQVLRGVLRGH